MITPEWIVKVRCVGCRNRNWNRVGDNADLLATVEPDKDGEDGQLEIGIYHRSGKTTKGPAYLQGRYLLAHGTGRTMVDYAPITDEPLEFRCRSGHTPRIKGPRLTTMVEDAREKSRDTVWI